LRVWERPRVQRRNFLFRDYRHILSPMPAGDAPEEP
jgi:hypothetical protein